MLIHNVMIAQNWSIKIKTLNDQRKLFESFETNNIKAILSLFLPKRKSFSPILYAHLHKKTKIETPAHF